MGGGWKVGEQKKLQKELHDRRRQKKLHAKFYKQNVLENAKIAFAEQ